MYVMLFHYFFRAGVSDNSYSLKFYEFGEIFKYGYLGVDFFFIISGFVIVLSISHRSVNRFVISRITRLYPVYWISVILTFSSIKLFDFNESNLSFSDFAFNLTMFQNYFGVKNVDGVYWTLFVEMKFYIFVICSYLFFNKITKIKLEYLIYFWLLISVFLLVFIFNDYSSIITKLISIILIPKYSCYFIAGMTFYLIFKNGSKFKYLLILSLCLIISCYYAIKNGMILQNDLNVQFSSFIICSHIVLFFLIFYLLTTGLLNRINSPKLYYLGILTYPLYLIHQNIGYIIFENFNGVINKYILVFLTIFFMLIVSLFISMKLEKSISSFLKNLLLN